MPVLSRLLLRFPFEQQQKVVIMSAIIISKGSYSHGGKVAEEVARKLNYECVSRDILIDISKKFNISELRLIRAIDDAPSFLEKYTFGREKYIAYIKSAILDKLTRGNVVYHGFAGHFFVEDVSHILKVRIIANREERLQSLMQRENISRTEADLVIDKIDDERTKWSMKLYGIDTCDCRQYDLVVNIGRISISDATDMICQTIAKNAFQPTVESQQKIEKLAGEALENLKKIHHVSPFFEPLRDSPFSKKRDLMK